MHNVNSNDVPLNMHYVNSNEVPSRVTCTPPINNWQRVQTHEAGDEFPTKGMISNAYI